MLCDRVLKILENNHLTKSACAQKLGITHKTLGSYLKPDGQHNLWQYLPTFMEWYPRLSRQWLYFGEGPMTIGQGVPIDAPIPFQELTRAAEAIAEDCGGAWGDVLKLVIGRAHEPAQSTNSPIPGSMPLVGFASCGREGWGGRMTYTVPVAAPHTRPDMIAVMATGESMIPAGIGHGMVCFCDPHAPPIEGECVYVETVDNKATLKRFLGGGQSEGGGEAIRLQGWKDVQGDMPQDSFTIEIDPSEIRTIAPVIYVQRRG